MQNSETGRAMPEAATGNGGWVKEVADEEEEEKESPRSQSSDAVSRMSEVPKSVFFF